MIAPTCFGLFLTIFREHISFFGMYSFYVNLFVNYVDI
jgi:hypothetical protein